MTDHFHTLLALAERAALILGADYTLDQEITEAMEPFGLRAEDHRSWTGTRDAASDLMPQGWAVNLFLSAKSRHGTGIDGSARRSLGDLLVKAEGKYEPGVRVALALRAMHKGMTGKRR